MKNRNISTNLFLSVLVVLFMMPSAKAIDAVASLGKLRGDVEVLRKIRGIKDSRKIPGRTGLILNDKDVVITGSRAKATIIFRDGSEIRLFQRTRFVIEKSEESKVGKRRFFHNFKLTLGSFWGKFTKGRQRTKIKTPTATIGIKGTNVAFSERDGRLDISLSSGLIEVENQHESILLQPGKGIMGMNKTGSIQDKVQDLPYRIMIRPDKSHIEVPDKGGTEEIFLTLQVIENKTQKNVYLSGNVYISMQLDKVVFDRNVVLNKRGYARIRALIKPFQKADYKNGQAQILAVMDGEQYLNIGAGQAVLTFDVPENMSRTIRVDVNSGNMSE